MAGIKQGKQQKKEAQKSVARGNKADRLLWRLLLPLLLLLLQLPHSHWPSHSLCQQMLAWRVCRSLGNNVKLAHLQRATCNLQQAASTASRRVQVDQLLRNKG